MSTDKKRYLDDGSNDLPYNDVDELINQVIKHLAIPPDNVPTTVSKRYNNDRNLNNEVQAYAKISGRDWTFYVKTLKVLIGRNTDSHNPEKIEDGVDIDLGPSKVVSRKHASIAYNLESRKWELVILGRNGLKIDGSRVNSTSDGNGPVVLSSGNIIDIGGTQMMFILPDAPPVVSNIFLQSLKNKRPKSELLDSHNSNPNNSNFSTDIYANNNVKAFQMYNKSSSNPNLDSSPNSMSKHFGPEQDFSKDESKDLKPPYSYATMITQAILSNTQGILSLSEIYDWIAGHYAFYRHSKQGWQNSIRHNLSLNKAFEKVPRKPNEPGKGMKWQISETYRKEFLKKWDEGTLNKIKRGSSVSRQLQLHLIKNKGLPDSGRTALQSSQTGSIGEQPKPQHSPQQQHQQTNGFQSKMYMPPHQPQQHMSSIQQSPNKVIHGNSHEALNYITAAASLSNSGITSNDVIKSELSSPIKSTSNLPEYRTNYQNPMAASTSQLNDSASSQERTTVKGSPKKYQTTNNSNINANNQLENFNTPERGSNKLQLDPPSSSSQSHPSINSSPALWNYVQFSTPLGGTSSRQTNPMTSNNNTGIGNGNGLHDDNKSPSKIKLELESPLRSRKKESSPSDHNGGANQVGDLKNIDLASSFKS